MTDTEPVKSVAVWEDARIAPGGSEHEHYCPDCKREYDCHNPWCPFPGEESLLLCPNHDFKDPTERGGPRDGRSGQGLGHSAPLPRIEPHLESLSGSGEAPSSVTDLETDRSTPPQTDHPEGGAAHLGFSPHPERERSGTDSGRFIPEPDGLNRLPRWPRYIVVAGLGREDVFELPGTPVRRVACSICGTHYPDEDIRWKRAVDGILEPKCVDCLATVYEPPEEDWSGF